MPTVRVFVPTYWRSHLLPRALRSLQAQTITSWIAEVHNDAPDDPEPARVVASLNDPRIRHVTHPQTMGGAGVFNLVFRDHPEPFVGLLEDDNWWHPDFLARMVDALQDNPDVTLAWSNQSVWEETPNGEWRDTRRLVRPGIPSTAPVRFQFPHRVQCFGALHANGAMLMRTRPRQSFPTPSMELGGTEAVRERALPHPLLYVPEPLGVFGATRITNRSREPLVWASNQVLLAATFLLHAPLSAEALAALWRHARAARPRMTPTLLLATRQDPTLRKHAVHATVGDLRQLAVRATCRPIMFVQLMRSRHRLPKIWEFLATQTAARAREAATQAPGLPPPF